MIKRKYKKGTPVRDRVEPRLQEMGYNTSSLRVVRFGSKGTTFEIVLDDRIVGEYVTADDKLHLYSLPNEQENAPE